MINITNDNYDNDNSNNDDIKSDTAKMRYKIQLQFGKTIKILCRCNVVIIFFRNK